MRRARDRRDNNLRDRRTAGERPLQRVQIRMALPRPGHVLAKQRDPGRPGTAPGRHRNPLQAEQRPAPSPPRAAKLRLPDRAGNQGRDRHDHGPGVVDRIQPHRGITGRDGMDTQPRTALTLQPHPRPAKRHHGPAAHVDQQGRTALHRGVKQRRVDPEPPRRAGLFREHHFRVDLIAITPRRAHPLKDGAIVIADIGQVRIQRIDRERLSARRRPRRGRRHSRRPRLLHERPACVPGRLLAIPVRS